MLLLLLLLFVELLEKHRLQEREMSKYSVQLQDLRVKLGQRDSEITDFKARVINTYKYSIISLGELRLIRTLFRSPSKPFNT